MKFKYLLILRYILVNSMGFAFLLALASQGYLKNCFRRYNKHDNNYYSIVLVGFTIALTRTLWISKGLNYVDMDKVIEKSLAAEFISKAEGLSSAALELI